MFKFILLQVFLISVCLLDFSKSRTLVHGQVFGRIAFDQILRLFFRGVDGVSFERDRGRYLFLDRSPHPARLRVPGNMIPCFEFVRRWYDLTLIFHLSIFASAVVALRLRRCFP